MTEVREHARMPIELEVRYGKLNSFFSDYTRNISKGGAFIETRNPLPPGTRFLFKLSVPGCGEPFQVGGEVLRTETGERGGGMAIRFTWSDAEARAAFEQAVEKLMADSLGPVVAAGLLEAAEPSPKR
jgi:type IV pilus assembly protein PilZ